MVANGREIAAQVADEGEEDVPFRGVDGQIAHDLVPDGRRVGRHQGPRTRTRRR